MELSKPAFSKLLESMKQLSIEINDQEICRRLETLMLTSKDDLNIISIKNLLLKPLEFDPKEIPEPYTQYVKHFIYMVKRNEKLGMNLYEVEMDSMPNRKILDKKKKIDNIPSTEFPNPPK